MEHLSRSASKKSYRDSGYAGKMKTTVYDDVFGGPPRFGGAPTISPRLEDYTEIFENFHAARGSSIPVLHLPAEAAGDDIFLDVRSSKFDYSEVFGGFDAADFGVSYEELFCGGNGNSDGGGKSSDDEWIRAQSGSLSDESDPSASPERNPSMSDGDLDQSFSRTNQLSVTHNKSSTKTEEDMSNSKTHVTHFHAVPGDKVISSSKIKDDQTPVQVSSDLHPSTDFGGLVTEEKRLRKTMSQPSEFGGGSYGTDSSLLSGHEKPCSNGTRPHLSVSDINLKTQPSQLPPPSRPPPSLTSNKKDSDRTSSRLKPSKSYAYERRGGDTSPTYFDVEIDASSSAAVSAEAMRDAMDKAQAKLRSAKESRERKKDGLSNRLKLSDNDSNDKESRVSKNGDKSNSFENERMLGECKGEGSRTRNHTSEGRHKLKKTTLVIPGSIEGQKGVPVAENSVQSKHGKERKLPSLGLCRTEETQFYEMLGDSNVRDANIFEQTTRSSEQGQNSGSVETFARQEDIRNINDGTEAYRWEEKQNQSEVCNGACEQNGSKERLLMPEKFHWQEHQEKVNVTRKACELKERGKKLSGSQIGKILKEADESEDYENLIEIQLKENNMEFEQKLKGTIGEDDPAKMLKNGFEKEEDQMTSAEILEWEYFVELEDSVERAENKRGVKKSVKQDEKEKQQKEASERINEKIREDLDRVESKSGVEQHHGLEENENRLKTASELEKIEKKSSMTLAREENKQKLVSEIQENKKMQEETRMQEENQNKLKEALARNENACERVENEKIIDDGWDEEENERMNKKALNSKASQKTSNEGLTADKSTNEAFKEEVNKKKLEDCDGKETEIMVQGAGDMDRLWEQNKDHKQVEMEEKKWRKNVNEESFFGVEVKNSKELHGPYASNDIEILQAGRVGKLDCGRDKFETTQEASPLESEGLFRNDTRDWEKEVEAVEGSEELIEKAKMRTEDIMSHDTAARSNDDSIAVDKSVNENDNSAPEVVSKLENANILVHSQVEGGKNMKGAQCCIDHEISKGNFTWPQSQEDGDGLEAETKNVDALPAVEGKIITISTAPKTTNQNLKMEDENHKETLTPAEKEKDEKLRRERYLENECLRKIEDREKEKCDKLRKERELENDRLREIEERKKEREDKLRKERELESDGRRKKEEEREKDEKLRRERALESEHRRKMEEEREKDEKLRTERALESERVKKIEEVRVKEKEEKLRRERELESDRLRKIEEERERQREREKDLMSVDKATLEAREKAFIEARERAERTAVDRAAAEVRQKALAEARERLEKACAEARERTFAGKASMEARLRAERTAVERAAAEARERAVEKGAAEKAAFDAQERDERSVADKLSSFSRSSEIKQNPSSSDLPDSHFRSLGSYSGSRYGHSSAYGGGESESPRRCKARLERHQRTAERAAKALAEKNMRDHLAQREQAERNRLAEGLDAEVKRWSSGKEGNLRALLSTLQYILGPDSGWQPVPLTDVITTAAVKKAYRKATLCVHPDKLQQRGASIHQKYICEKVFDLLKEAWNKFNSEER